MQSISQLSAKKDKVTAKAGENIAIEHEACVATEHALSYSRASVNETCMILETSMAMFKFSTWPGWELCSL